MAKDNSKITYDVKKRLVPLKFNRIFKVKKKYRENLIKIYKN